MSRTDKDRPLWVRNTDTTLPLVAWHEHLYRRDSEGRFRRIAYGACSLLTPDEQRASIDYQFHHNWLECEWRVAWWSREGGGWRGNGPSRGFVKASWNGPERVQARLSLREAAKEYNGRSWEEDEGGFDFDYPNIQHRHQANHWWYW